MISPQTFTYSTPDQPFLQRSLIRAIERLTGQKKLYRLYCEFLQERKDNNETFWDGAVRKLDLDLAYDQQQFSKIPKQGPLLVVANHPFGVVDGVIVNHIMAKVRQDYKVMTNSVLCQVPETQGKLLPVDFGGTKAAMQTNLNTRKQAKNVLKNDGCIVVFPAGGVSTIPSWKHKVAEDAEWQPFTSRLLMDSQATVVPIYFEGQNSMLFQLASHISATLRLSLFFKEVHDRVGTTINMQIGDPIPFEQLQHIEGRKELSEHLRNVTYDLAEAYC